MDRNGSKTSLRSFLKIATLAAKAHRDPKFQEDGPVALKIYREARDLTLPWPARS